MPSYSSFVLNRTGWDQALLAMLAMPTLQTRAMTAQSQGQRPRGYSLLCKGLPRRATHVQKNYDHDPLIQSRL
jgi:hypothetical protein